MSSSNSFRGFLLAFAAVAPLAASPSMAQAPIESVDGKRINLIISFGAGGTYGIYGRLVADHISRHLPGSPTVIVQHMPGAGGIVATNHLYNLAPKDGTTAAMLLKDIALTPFATMQESSTGLEASTSIIP